MTCLAVPNIQKKKLKQILFSGHVCAHSYGLTYLPVSQMIRPTRFMLTFTSLEHSTFHMIFISHAHAMTAQLSCHVQNSIAIISLQLEWEQNEIFIKFELRWKIIGELGLWSITGVQQCQVQLSAIRWQQSPKESRADSRFVSSQWETALLCNDVSHWLGASLELALRKQLLNSSKKAYVMEMDWHKRP